MTDDDHVALRQDPHGKLNLEIHDIHMSVEETGMALAVAWEAGETPVFEVDSAMIGEDARTPGFSVSEFCEVLRYYCRRSRLSVHIRPVESGAKNTGLVPADLFELALIDYTLLINSRS